ncbi:MAG: helix-turn-helix domain-containing protein [Zoogloeaceae bacterium]|jgi:lambda repressor-like predicted transcriptional regulator|nr:helix-turn-helix domain-containing protein [Zoogloeaceae bacterium]
MHVEEIKAAMRIHGMTQTALAESLGVNRATVTQVINGISKSERIQKAIAKLIGKPVKEIWPGQVRLRRSKAEMAAWRAAHFDQFGFSRTAVPIATGVAK